MTARFSPTTILWLAGHLLVTFIGFLLVSVEAFHTTFGKGVSEGIGASLIASGITGLTLYLYLKQSDTLQQRL